MRPLSDFISSLDSKLSPPGCKYLDFHWSDICTIPGHAAPAVFKSSPGGREEEEFLLEWTSLSYSPVTQFRLEVAEQSSQTWKWVLSLSVCWVTLTLQELPSEDGGEGGALPLDREDVPAPAVPRLPVQGQGQCWEQPGLVRARGELELCNPRGRYSLVQYSTVQYSTV